MKRQWFLARSLAGLGAFLLLAVMAIPTTVYADDPPPTPNNGTCISCHEDLYFLHDTGKWYCLREAPMSCVNCHGGDPMAATQEQAHTDRALHPVLNGDVAKCQQCHPEECNSRVQIFSQMAGISEVRVAIPYDSSSSADLIALSPIEDSKGSGGWRYSWEFIVVLLTGLAALGAYALHKRWQ